MGWVAIISSAVWLVTAIVIGGWAIRLASREEMAAPPVGLGVVAVLVPVILAAAVWGMVLGRRLRRGDRSLRRLARITFSAYLLAATLLVPVIVGDGSVQPVEWLLLVMSAAPVAGLVLDAAREPGGP